MISVLPEALCYQNARSAASEKSQWKQSKLKRFKCNFCVTQGGLITNEKTSANAIAN